MRIFGYIHYELNARQFRRQCTAVAAFGAGLVLYRRWLPFVLVFSAGGLVSQGFDFVEQFALMRFTAWAKHLVPSQAPLFEDALHRLCDAGRDPGGNTSSNAFLQFLFVLGLQLRAQGMTVGFVLFVERGL